MRLTRRTHTSVEERRGAGASARQREGWGALAGLVSSWPTGWVWAAGFGGSWACRVERRKGQHGPAAEINREKEVGYAAENEERGFPISFSAISKHFQKQFESF